jgi:superfamily II RNA helicase
MPARSVIIDELKKRYDRFTRVIKTRDFYQMSGRAGRRGIDKRGFVYSFVNPLKITFEELKRLKEGKPEPIISKFNATYSTILNLYQTHGEKLLNIYKRSFHFFQTKNKKPSISFEQMKARLQVLKDLKYIDNNKLTNKGEFAKLIHGYGLILSELFENGYLENIDYRELAVLSLSIVYEPKPGSRMPRLSEKYKRIRAHTTDAVNKIHYIEERNGLLSKSKRCYFDLSFPLYEWMNEKDFEEIIFSVKIDEGELIRYYRMAIQLMRELLRTHIAKSVKEQIETAIALMNYGVIDAENQLKNIIKTLNKEKD